VRPKENVLGIPGHFFKKNGAVLGKRGRMGTLVLNEKVFNYFINHRFISLVNKFSEYIILEKFWRRPCSKL